MFFYTPPSKASYSLVATARALAANTPSKTYCISKYTLSQLGLTTAFIHRAATRQGVTACDCDRGIEIRVGT